MFANPWRNMLLQQASFRGVIFHVETGARSSGRRAVVHEYPKRNDPNGEDMGRQARRFQIQGYLIYNPSSPLYEYTSQRTALYNALEADDTGRLIHPVFAPGGMSVLCERYSMMENRTRGGFTEFEMQFVEAGSAGNSAQIVNTVSQVASQASNVDASTTNMMDNAPTDPVWSSGAPAFRDYATGQLPGM
jgi:prophage DNA circulation protein